MNGRGPDPREDFDGWLRRQAPAPPGEIEAEQDRLWRTLHARRSRRESARPGLVGTLAALLLLAASPFEVGSDANRPIVRHEGERGVVYRAPLTKAAIYGLGQYSGDEIREQAFAAIVEAEVTRSAPLGGVTGYRIGGRTSVVVVYQPERGGAVYPTGFEPVFPANEDLPEGAGFIHRYAGEFQERIARSTAHDAGTTCAFVDGRPMALHRWTSSFPGYGIVTYIAGEPLR